MAGKKGDRLNKPSLKPAANLVQVQVKSEPQLTPTETSTRKRKEVWNEEAKSCSKCHRDLLVVSNKWHQGTSDPQAFKPCSGCSNLDNETEPAVEEILQEPLAKVANIPNDEGTTAADSVGLFNRINLWLHQKILLAAVNDRYPDTFKRIKIRSNRHWLTILEDLYAFIKRFLDSSVDVLAEDGITSLEEDLDDFESLGFDLSWARERLEMVKNLKFGNDPLRLKLMVDEECVNVTWKEMIEASVRLEKARSDYNKAVDNRTKTVNEVGQKFGATYDDVVNGNLGFGMLPGH